MPDSGYWTGQARVSSPNSHYGSTSRIAIDSTGIPWVVWIGYTYDDPSHAVWYSRWDGNAWTQQLRVSDPETLLDFQPRITMDGSGNPWVIWMRRVNNIIHNIFYSRWEGSQWQPESQVNPPDSVTVGYGSVGYGGDRVWVSWERGRWGLWGDIWAVYWMGTHWSRPYRISEDDGIEDGIPFNMAVDQDGRAHFVWTRRTTEGLFPLYRSYDGDSLSPIFYLNENGGGIQGDWPAITVDLYGNVHVVWTGIMEYPPLNSYVFYRMFDGNQWTEPVVINRVDGLGNWRPSISAMSPDDIWVVWDGTDSTGEYHIYAVHYDGIEWSDETQLDNDDTNDDVNSDISFDIQRNLWVVWSGYELSTETRQVYYNSYQAMIIKQHTKSRILTNQWISTRIFADGLYIEPYNPDGKLKIQIFNKSGMKILDHLYRTSSKIYLQLDFLPSGIYFLILNFGGQFYKTKIIKIGR
jgi:hypothetical protein